MFVNCCLKLIFILHALCLETLSIREKVYCYHPINILACTFTVPKQSSNPESTRMKQI